MIHAPQTPMASFLLAYLQLIWLGQRGFENVTVEMNADGDGAFLIPTFPSPSDALSVLQEFSRRVSPGEYGRVHDGALIVYRFSSSSLQLQEPPVPTL